MDSSAVSARLIGAIFVEKGLVTEEQLERALEQQRTTGDRLGEILVEQFGIERLDLANALAEQWAEYERQGNAEDSEAHQDNRDVVAASDERRGPAPTSTPSAKRPIGEIFVERGLVTDEQLEEALELQKASGTRLGEILVASGRLSRLELASALADQWATFQKLRPPEEPAARGVGDVMPTPEVAAPPPAPAASTELVSRVDALATRIDQVAAEKTDWKPQVEKTAELLRARIEQLEEQLMARKPESSDDLRGELSALAERIEAIPAPTDEWRLELAQVAENLRTRIERIEHVAAADQLAELRTSLEGLAQRLDSLPAPSEEWRDAVAGLAGRIDALPTPSEEWREQIAALQTTIAQIGQAQAEHAGGGEELRASLEALVERVESMPAPSDDWRTEIEAIRRQFEQSGDSRDGVLAELRASLDALAARVESLPVPSEEWREQLADVSARVDAMQEPSEDWREGVADLAARVDSLPTDAWRPELAEVAENLRTRVERVEQGLKSGSAVEELAELRASLDALAARVESLPVPSEEWRDAVAGLAGRIDALPASSEEWRERVADLAARVDSLPTDAWRPELAEVAENLRTRVERVEQGLRSASTPEELAELRASLDVLITRVESLPVPSEEWRDAVAGLAGRIDALPASSEEWREPMAQLAARVDGLPVSSEAWREQIADLAGRIDALRTDEWRPELAEVAENLRTRVERVEQGLPSASTSEELAELRASLDALITRVESLPVPSEEWREQLADLSARIDAVQLPSDEWRAPLTDLAARVESLPTDAWRPELAEVAENLRTRVERVEQGLRSASAPEELAELRASLDALITRVESLPVPSEDWREPVAGLTARVEALTSDDWRSEVANSADTLRTRIARIEEGMIGQARAAAVTEIAAQVDELARKVADTDTDVVTARLQALAAQLDALPASAQEWREPLAHLAERIDGLPVPSEEWREQIADLAARVDTMRTDDWRSELAQVAENLRLRVEQTERGLADSHAEQLDGLQGDVAELTARIDAIPTSSDDVRAQLAELAETFHTRVQQIEQRLSNKVRSETLEGVFARLDELSTKVDDTSALESRLRGSVAALVDERAQELETDGADVRGRLDDVLHRIAAVSGVAERVDEVERRLEIEATAAAGLAPVVDELKESAERDGRRIETLAQRINEAAERGDVAGVKDELAGRIDSTESALADLRSGLEALPSSVEERIAAAETRAAALSDQASADVVSLRRELDDLRAVVGATRDANSSRIDDLAASLRAELAGVSEHFAGTEAFRELRSAVEHQGARLEELGGELVTFEHYADEKAAVQSVELSALRSRLEAVDSVLAETTGWADAVATTHARVDGLEAQLVETAASEAVERNAEIETLRSQLSQRVEALESSLAKRKDVRELRDALKRVEQRVDDRRSQDDASTRAVEEALREGLASLGDRLTATEATYLDAGRALRRSIEGLGHAISGADAHLAGVAGPPAAEQTEPTAYVAFAPTPEGYRLVVCDGGTPVLGGKVEIPQYEGTLVVTRVGASPLPFDVRPCVYLELA